MEKHCSLPATAQARPGFGLCACVQDGQPQGPPTLMKSDVGRLRPLGVTRSGALYFGVRVGSPDIYVTSVAFSSGKLLSPPTPATEQFMGFNSQPDWSPDGKYLAYVTIGPTSLSNILSIQSVESGKTRQLHPRL